MPTVHACLPFVTWNTKLLKKSSRPTWVSLRLGSDQKGVLAPKDEVVRFISDCMRKAGAKSDDGHIVGHHLMTADYRGHFSHGMNRLTLYVKDLESGMTDAKAEPEVVKDCKAVALVSGNNALGQVIGNFCMELAIKKAKKFGIGMVSARGSNHYGICAYYTSMAIEQQLIGFTCTNTSPLMAPTRSKKSALGTNPLSLGMGAKCGDEFLLDMATTAVALGKIELAVRKKENIPEGWALGSDGKVTTNSEEAFKAATLMPLGGEERNSGYKGYGLALMVEVLCGILSGSQFGPNIRKWTDKKKIADLGHCFMAIDPEAFGCGSKARLTELLQQLRELPKIGDKPVLVPGDPERAHMMKVDKEGGIEYHANMIIACEELAKHMGVKPMKLIAKKN
ncbi:uncharacterized protein LOC108622231 [Ceratina calcarata]|uniref:Uncharacterized protein LOC108622231 n=1 Tax=Ceratina calcarata TaxID=156304 RepID=A0AAJ7IRH8_9HYME|nr:uncharacterized protein LOC108622231 [Ceratina calcarata]XP_017875452.1 uncharacterized protein LOC108622231 [Ceratina calcarata]XP_026667143.1 uncharacterized protein LOC108622231 [Ceratina calcarata]XP_026667144.1 uncharacterized protein LOC108622231 [Ceratina calcarata]